MAGTDRHTIVVVDDDDGVRETLADYLCLQGYEIRQACSGAELDAVLVASEADLVLLDVNMPGEDGFAVARRLRATLNMPVIMVTAVETVIDRVAGLEAGADDYLTKPFDLREVRSRIRAVLRRYSEATIRSAPNVPAGVDTATADGGRQIRLGHIAIDLDAHRLIGEDGNGSTLTMAELGLLQAFIYNPYKVLSREQLFDLTGVPAAEAESRVMDVRIARLRKKIELDPTQPVFLKTIRGAGYLFAPPKRPA